MDFIKIPKITKAINFSEYAPEFGEAHVEVWVNPPKSLLNEQSQIVLAVSDLVREINKLNAKKPIPTDDDIKKVDELRKKLETLNEQLTEWYAKVISQDGQPISIEDLSKLFDAAIESDPRFLDFLRDRTLGAILEHREQRKN